MKYLTQVWQMLPDAIAYAVAIILVGAFGALIILFPPLFILWVFFGVRLIRPRTPKRHKPRFQSKFRKAGKWSKSYMTDPHNRSLQHQLVRMLQGDVATAKRLLKQKRQQQPGQTDNWYLEKVIYDLKRDRH
jgi:hypothetical protein